ncbi:sensor histidine kinase [Desulfonatronovibrio magnus]|uniref:sensor histidine kinase n=1 Tax=Desulfonatronovibrio magnus TaxID=698827 RepID=UPI0006969991|nr:PAS domain-containing sensor histidine kinase [Desulfonatronovibrio magnus]
MSNNAIRNESTRKQRVYGGAVSENGHPKTPNESVRYAHRRLRHGILLCLLLTYIVPIIILSLYFHNKFNTNMRESSKQQLTAIAEAQKNTIDLFMQKRVVNVFNLFHMADFSLKPSQERMDHYLKNLIMSDDAFADIGLINSKGIQTYYAGPYPNLKGKDYSSEEWFIQLTNQSKSYIITDLYLGLRLQPHFTIGVRQMIDGEYHVVRASVYPGKLESMIGTISNGINTLGFVVNTEGIFQVGEAELGQLLEPAYYAPGYFDRSGVVVMDWHGQEVLAAHTWLNEVPWCLIMLQQADEAFSEMTFMRNTLIIGTILLILVIMIFIGVVVNLLLSRAMTLDQERNELKGQLYHAHKVISVGQLVGEVAHEINNPLAIIDAESGIIRDMLDPEMDLDASPEAIRKELDQIDKAVVRARGITREILTFVRKSQPRFEECNLNDLFEEAVSGMKQKELHMSDISLIKDLADNLPRVYVDPDLMRQVFVNLLNNARDAVAPGDVITLKTDLNNGFVEATVSDSGAGMTEEQLERIFTPFFTTKEKGRGTGLGLPICLNIVEGFGGQIKVESAIGKGTLFTVVLPQAQDLLKNK